MDLIGKDNIKILGWLKGSIVNILKPRWIVTAEGDLGLRLLGINFIYYKWPEPMYSITEWRYADKREFGESVISKKGF